MISNDVIAEAISGLAAAIRLLNFNGPSSRAAAYVEGIIRSACVQEQSDQMELLSKRLSEAMAASASRQRELDAASAPAMTQTPAITAAMCALAERATMMRDDQLNVLMYGLMQKLNTQDVKEWLAFDAQRSAAGSATSEVP